MQSHVRSHALTCAFGTFSTAYRFCTSLDGLGIGNTSSFRTCQVDVNLSLRSRTPLPALALVLVLCLGGSVLSASSSKHISLKTEPHFAALHRARCTKWVSDNTSGRLDISRQPAKISTFFLAVLTAVLITTRNSYITRASYQLQQGVQERYQQQCPSSDTSLNSNMESSRAQSAVVVLVVA